MIKLIETGEILNVGGFNITIKNLLDNGEAVELGINEPMPGELSLTFLSGEASVHIIETEQTDFNLIIEKVTPNELLVECDIQPECQNNLMHSIILFNNSGTNNFNTIINGLIRDNLSILLHTVNGKVNLTAELPVADSDYSHRIIAPITVEGENFTLYNIKTGEELTHTELLSSFDEYIDC